MAQNNKFFIETLSVVLNALSNLSLRFTCRQGISSAGEEYGDNYFMRIKVFKGNTDFEITVGSNDKVYLTFESSSPNSAFSAEPRVLSPSSDHAGARRITYGKNLIQNIEDDIKQI